MSKKITRRGSMPGGKGFGGKPLASVTQIGRLRQQREKAKADIESLTQHADEFGYMQAGLHEFLKINFADTSPEVVASATMFYSARIACQVLGMNSKSFSLAAKDAFKAMARELKE